MTITLNPVMKTDVEQFIFNDIQKQRKIGNAVFVEFKPAVDKQILRANSRLSTI